MTAAEIRSAARRAGHDATAENCIHHTGEAAEVWLEGFIAGLEQMRNPDLTWSHVDRLLEEAREVLKTVATP